MKSIITEDDWKNWQQDIIVDYARDNHFSELKETELLTGRLQTLDQLSAYIGEYYSKEWVMKNVLHLDDNDIKDMKKQIGAERASGELPDPNEQLPQE